MKKGSYICVGLLGCVLAAGHAAVSKAATTGTIALRAVVKSQAVVRMASVSGDGSVATSGGRAIDVSSSRDGIAVFILTRFANSASGFTVGMTSDNASRLNQLAMLSSDGVAVPYRILFNGRELALSQGLAHLATVTRHDDPQESDAQLEISAPGVVATAGKAFADHLVLVIAAR